MHAGAVREEDVSSEGLKVSPVARWAAIVPVVVIAGAIIAFMLGAAPEGRRYTAAIWRTHAVAEHDFAVAAPGVFTVNFQTMFLDGEDISAQTYVASDRGADFSVTVVRRPDADARPLKDVAADLGVRGVDGAPGAGGTTVFRHDVALDGRRIQAHLIFHDRMLYQVMVTAPEKAFRPEDAARFFSSFRVQTAS